MPMLMQPSQADVRRFFCSVHEKFVQGAHLEPLEIIASQWMQEHTEYAADFADVDLALQMVYDVDGAQTNPFLHLSMHLSITEQCSIDQPSGIRQAVELLTARRGDLHEAHHEVMEELGVMVWESQRNAQPPNGQAYVERVQQRATRD